MNILICGAGRVGFTIAKLLSELGHSITVIDQSSEDIQKINDLDVLIEFFEQRERYEDCGYLLQIKDKIIANAEFKVK